MINVKNLPFDIMDDCEKAFPLFQSDCKMFLFIYHSINSFAPIYYVIKSNMKFIFAITEISRRGALDVRLANKTFISARSFSINLYIQLITFGYKCEFYALFLLFSSYW